MKDPETALREFVSDEIDFRHDVPKGRTTHTRESLRALGENMFWRADFFSDEKKWLEKCFKHTRGWGPEEVEVWWVEFFGPQSLVRFTTPLEAKVYLRDMCRGMQFPDWRKRDGADSLPGPAPVAP